MPSIIASIAAARRSTSTVAVPSSVERGSVVTVSIEDGDPQLVVHAGAHDGIDVLFSSNDPVVLTDIGDAFAARWHARSACAMQPP